MSRENYTYLRKLGLPEEVAWLVGGFSLSVAAGVAVVDAACLSPSLLLAAVPVSVPVPAVVDTEGSRSAISVYSGRG